MLCTMWAGSIGGICNTECYSALTFKGRDYSWFISDPRQFTNITGAIAMKTLPQVRATPEQLPIISSNRPGAEVIRGAAGSGKTSTALLRLRSLFYMFQQRRLRQGESTPVRILVLTFNRTLAGYIESLAETQLDGSDGYELQITTFGKWARNAIPAININERAASDGLWSLIQASSIKALTPQYLLKEVDYILGRFDPGELEAYTMAERTGRGAQPRVDRASKRKILDEIVYPYQRWLSDSGLTDWNGLAVKMANTVGSLNYDVVVVDESQDFSANQLRAIRRHLADVHAITFVIDTVQRIYARGFTWVEAGFTVRPERFHTLAANHRNTRQIAAFAMGILNGIAVEVDGALPNLEGAVRNGPAPTVLRGLYGRQLAWAIEFIRTRVDLSEESVAFLAPQATWFAYTIDQLCAHALPFVDVTRESVWPEGIANIALCTFHSAKGLEFDHVFILGLSNQNTIAGDGEADDEVLVQRRLLAVAVARARQTVTIGYKPGEESHLVGYFDSSSYVPVDL